MRYKYTVTEQISDEKEEKHVGEITSTDGFRRTADKIIEKKYPNKKSSTNVYCDLTNVKQGVEFEFLYEVETTTKIKFVRTIRRASKEKT